MKSLTDSYKLHNGVEIPCIGFGTWQAADGAQATSSVEASLKAGYVHIDTAAGYGNERSVGQAVRQSGIDRKKLFITSKLNNPDHGYEATLAAFELTMANLDMAYLDLYLIHWPNPVMFRDKWQEMNAGSWKAFEELYAAGRVRAIGVSNFLPHHMDALMETAKVVPMVNQIRLCPGGVQAETVEYCRARGIVLEAYSPLGTGSIFKVPEIQRLAQKYDRSVAQLCVRWSLQMGFLPLPKSVTPERIRENGQVFDFELSDDDVALMASLKDCCGPANDPDSISW